MVKQPCREYQAENNKPSSSGNITVQPDGGKAAILSGPLTHSVVFYGVELMLGIQSSIHLTYLIVLEQL